MTPIVRVDLGPRAYDIAVGTATDNALVDFLRTRIVGLRRPLLVTDTNARPHADRLATVLQAAGVSSELTVVPAGEGSKSLEQLNGLYGKLAALRAERTTCIIAVGGGVVGDLAGFAAATYNRGLRLVMAPTTLLAMVDSAVGGKVGINLPQGKNLVGAFHQPAAVWIDTAALATLPEREYRSGLAEVVKYGVILDPELFLWLEGHVEEVLARAPGAVEHVVTRSCALKAGVVQRDEREETGARMILNYGHTFAHAFEAVAGYGAWLHGEAVAAGMMYAALLAMRRGMVAADLVHRQRKLLQQFHLPATRDPSWDVGQLLSAMQRDKKNLAGQLRFILPARLGHVQLVDDVTEAEVRAALAGA